MPNQKDSGAVAEIKAIATKRHEKAWLVFGACLGPVYLTVPISLIRSDAAADELLDYLNDFARDRNDLPDAGFAGTRRTKDMTYADGMLEEAAAWLNPNFRYDARKKHTPIEQLRQRIREKLLKPGVVISMATRPE